MTHPDARVPAGTAKAWACCAHCEHDGDYVPDQHAAPCPEGCNDQEGTGNG